MFFDENFTFEDVRLKDRRDGFRYGFVSGFAVCFGLMGIAIVLFLFGMNIFNTM